MFKSMHEMLAGADAAKDGVDDWSEQWANAVVKTQNMPRNFDAEPKTEDEWTAFVKMKAATLSILHRACSDRYLSQEGLACGRFRLEGDLD